MPTQPIPFVPSMAGSQEELAGASQAAVNVVIDGSGSVSKRPGVGQARNIATTAVDANGVIGIFDRSDGAGLYIVTSDAQRSVYRLSASLGQFVDTGGDLSGANSKRPVFAETEGMTAIAAGSAPYKVLPSTHVLSSLGGSPPTCTHIVANSSRLVSNSSGENLGQLRYSDLATNGATSGHEDWVVRINGPGFVTAEARPDAVLALGENSNELFAWGETSVQIFAPTPASVYAPLTTKEHGTAAPYGHVKYDQAFFWLDHKRRFVGSDGRSVQAISDPIQAQLNDMSVVSDAFGYRVMHGNTDVVVWTFPSDGRTFAYNPAAKAWSQWAGWDDSQNSWTRFIVNCHHQSPSNADNLVGTTSGKIGAIKASADDDLGGRIVAHVETGFLNRGTDSRKRCKKVCLVLRRGEPTGSPSRVRIQWRDSTGPWEPPIEVDMGATGDDMPVVELYSMGVYRRRQWRFTFSDAGNIALVSATEDFSPMEN